MVDKHMDKFSEESEIEAGTPGRVWLIWHWITQIGFF